MGTLFANPKHIETVFRNFNAQDAAGNVKGALSKTAPGVQHVDAFVVVLKKLSQFIFSNNFFLGKQMRVALTGFFVPRFFPWGSWSGRSTDLARPGWQRNNLKFFNKKYNFGSTFLEKKNYLALLLPEYFMFVASSWVIPPTVSLQ